MSDNSLFKHLQETHDNREPPQDPDDHVHDWVYKGSAKDGTTFYRCRGCGRVEEL